MTDRDSLLAMTRKEKEQMNRTEHLEWGKERAA